MGKALKKEDGSNKIDLWIKIVPIALTAIGLFFGIYKGSQSTPSINVLEQESWKKTREVYSGIADLTAKIIEAKSRGKQEYMDSLYHQFISYKVVRLKAVNESKRVNDQMTEVYDVLQDAVKGNEDILNPNNLEDACRKLADSIKVSINEGDMKYGKPE
jgi:hypothetical protein